MEPDWVFEGRTITARHVILLAFAMDPGAMAEAPDLAAGVEVMHQYTRAVRCARDLADWMQTQGIPARAETGPMANDLLMIPAALAAGLGELGKHGSIIHRRLGARFRLAAVLTDLDLQPDRPDDFGADAFCAHCRICSDWCPPDAIFRDKQTVRGAVKWYVDFDRCLPFFNETAGCAICVTVCPFSDPDKGPSLVAKLARRRARGEGAEVPARSGDEREEPGDFTSPGPPVGYL